MSSMKKSRIRASRCSIPRSCNAPSAGLISGAAGLGAGFGADADFADFTVRPSSAIRSGGSFPPNRSAKKARKANTIRFKVDFAPIIQNSNGVSNSRRDIVSYQPLRLSPVTSADGSARRRSDILQPTKAESAFASGSICSISFAIRTFSGASLRLAKDRVRDLLWP